MHFYDSVTVFERGTHTKKQGQEMGGWPEKVTARVKRKLGLGI
jgi:hypothetical protein